MKRPLRDQVAVVTNAASRIGRETARLLARRGTTLVLAGRRASALEAIARELEAAGTIVIQVETDMTDEKAVRDLARTAIETFGRIDAWIHVAGAGTGSRNSFHGARAVLPYFREQRGGVLVDTSPTLRDSDEDLRQEVAGEGISVFTVDAEDDIPRVILRRVAGNAWRAAPAWRRRALGLALAIGVPALAAGLLLRSRRATP